MFWAVSLLVLSASADLRLELTRYQLEGRFAEAIERIETAGQDGAAQVSPVGLDYLKGHILESLGRDRAAQEAFARSLTTAEPLAPFGLFRLALSQERQGHPEVSAGLLAKLLANRPPKRLVRPAVEVLTRTIEDGADCRLLGRSDDWRIDQSPLRLIQVARAGCDVRARSPEDAIQRLVALLERNTSDEAARLAADRLSRLVDPAAGYPSPPSPSAPLAPLVPLTSDTALLLGQVYHAHRQFEPAIVYLKRGLDGLEADDLEARYALARSHFWLQQYLIAASEFGKIAAGAAKLDLKAKALYQQGRSYELSGNWTAATASYRIAYLAQTDGRWADAALISALRIEWRMGAEKPALELYEVLGSQRSWARIFESASVFLASSEIVRNRPERAGEWLRRARRARREPSIDATYWSARLAELENDSSRAVELYTEVLTDNPYHPLATASRQRLARPQLAPSAQELGGRIARSTSTAGLYGAVVLLAKDDPAVSSARSRLTELLATKSSARALLELRPRSAEEWPIWQAEPQRPEELLLGLGLWGEGEPAILGYFPIEQPDLALTAVKLLEQAGSLRPALRIAEILYQRAVSEMPIDLLPESLRTAAYPFHFRDLIFEQSSRFDVDPFLLAAIVREESRFDSRALSSAAARGLTQFVISTAQRLGDAIGLENLQPEDLYQPEVALSLGAAYLAELRERFADQPYAVIAAYNAGENQAELWRSYCFSREPEEYFSKVGFPETRGYLAKVLESRELYAHLYGAEALNRPTELR